MLIDMSNNEWWELEDISDPVTTVELLQVKDEELISWDQRKGCSRGGWGEGWEWTGVGSDCNPNL